VPGGSETGLSGFCFTPSAGSAKKRKIPGGLGDSVPQVLLGSPDEKNQLIHRCRAPFVRHVLAEFRSGQISAQTAAAELELSRSHFYELYSDYLGAGILRDQNWSPGVSGGDHAAQWPAGVEALLRARLSSRPASSYSFVASEVLRLCDFRLDRAQVRRWAMKNQLARPARAQKPPASVRRWQRSRIGELWQLDASPHQYFPGSRRLWPMLNMIDDCSRLFTGSKLYQQEVLLAYFDFLPQAFCAYGLPLMLYVDYHSLFFSSTPDALTTLGEALKFYDVTFRYAPTPQAKGKIEREHQFWQNRLPPYFAAEQIKTLEAANPHIDALRQHHNAKEIHREIKMPPQQAWELALKQKRSALRPAPNCPWWPYIWSLRSSVRVGPQGRVPVGTQTLPVTARPGSRVVLCHHPSGCHSVIAHHPKPKTQPILLFTNRPK
jgi:hypothetical protein